MFDLHPEENRDAPDDHGTITKGVHALLRRGTRSQDAAVDVVRERTGHGHEQPAEGAHKRGEGAGTRDAAHDGTEIWNFRVQDAREFEDDFISAFRAGGGVEVRQEVAPQHAKDRRKEIEDADENHHPHGGAFRGDAIGIRVEAHQDVRKTGCAADEGDDERVGVEERIRAGLLGR